MKVFMLLGDDGDGEPACGPRELGSLPDQIERLPCGEGGERTLAPGKRSKPRMTASEGVVCTDTRKLC